MKNIHLIPTDKSSGLCINGKNGQNICITSNEEIKANVYCLINGVLCKTELLNDKIVSRQLSGGATMDICKSEYSEIILTTDQDLINDGVQAIDDEFLEWFVKNPSCEEVEVDRIELNTDYRSDWKQKFRYKIIIPKEEQKQHLIDMMRYDEELGLYEEPKQYTFKEVKPKDIQRIIASTNAQTASIEILQLFSQYQAKRMYSDEEVFNLCRAFATFVAHKDPSYKKQQEWFEQFKKY